MAEKNPFEKLSKSAVEETFIVVEEAPKEEKAPVAEKATRRSAKQVEEEAAKREAKLQKQIDELKAALEKKADTADIAVVKDRVILEDGAGGNLRVTNGGRSLVNDDWRATVDGLRLILGRSSTQSTQQFQIPVSLVGSLAELLSNVSEIQE